MFCNLKDQVLHEVIQLFSETAAEVSEVYFLLPVAGLITQQQRERNYCYELYRLLRNNWKEGINYTINGEVDKIRHPIIESQCGMIKPDFIIHKPGMMGSDDNLLIVEVKTASGAKMSGLLKDIQTLNCMTSMPNDYYSSLLFIVGPTSDGEQNQIIETIYKNLKVEQSVFLMFHYAIGVPASIYQLKKLYEDT